MDYSGQWPKQIRRNEETTNMYKTEKILLVVTDGKVHFIKKYYETFVFYSYARFLW